MTPFQTSSPHIVIVGGGLAGLAAASALVDRGLRITILESRPRLGGRASSFYDPATGELVDNCQHVSMACCTNLADFCRRVGIDAMFRRERGAGLSRSRGSSLAVPGRLRPAPFHLAGSFLAAKFLERGRQAPRGLTAWPAWPRVATTGAGESFADWLLRHRQSRPLDQPVLGARARLGPERAARADGRRPRSQGLPRRVPAEPDRVSDGDSPGSAGRALRHAARELAARPRRRRSVLTTGVRAVELDDDGAVRGVVLRSGEQIAADFVVLAVPFDRVGGLDSRARCAIGPPALAQSGRHAVPRRSPASTSGSTGRSARSTTS